MGRSARIGITIQHTQEQSVQEVNAQVAYVMAIAQRTFHRSIINNEHKIKE